MSIIELFRDLWMTNGCVKFEELSHSSFTSSKVTVLDNENCRRRKGQGQREKLSQEYNQEYNRLTELKSTYNCEHIRAQV